MNVLFYSSNSPYPEIISFKGQIGGAEINLRSIAENLSKKNHNCFFYSPKKGFPITKNINGVITYHKPDIYIPLFHKIIPQIRKVNDKLILIQRKRNIEKIIKSNKIDLIHTYATYPDTYISILAGKKYNIPIVQKIAGRAWYNLLKEKPYLKEKINWTFDNVDLIVFISDYIKNQTFNYFNELGFKINIPYKICCVGIDYNKLENLDIEKVKSKYKLSDDDNNILCVASFKYHSKRQDILIKAIKKVVEKIDNLKVIFIGKGPTLKKMKKLANQLGIKDNICFLGEISHPEVLAIMSTVKIIVHPTEFESYSNIMRESLSLGKTFLVSNISPLNKFIEDGYNGMLAENNPDSFADKIVYLLNNDKIRKKIEINASKYAEKNFICEKNMNNYDDLFTNIQM